MSNEDFPRSYSMYSNIHGYLGLPLTRDLDAADVFVVGLPYDLATSGRSGTREGPLGIRAASAQLRWEGQRWPWDFDLFERLRIADYGDLEYPFGNHEALFASVAEHYGRLLAAGKTTLTFGGDHFITLPLLRAHAQQHGRLAMIHFDAHTDTHDAEDSVYFHGSMFYHAPREGIIDADHSVQVGIRTFYYPQSHEFEVIDAAAANDLAVDEIVARIKARVGDLPCYLTFDIDCLDPAYAPGTGTPVAGGLTTDRALKIIRGLTDIKLVGMDLVEVAPAYDHAQITSLAGATLGLEMLHTLAADPSPRP